jgi:hypothetical protein
MVSILWLSRGLLRDQVWAVDEVPVAFWSWGSHTPQEADVQRAVDEARARALFIHSGQIDRQTERLRRIRAVRGEFPRGIDLHLVYNATRDLLAHFELVAPTDLAAAVCNAYLEDAARAEADGAQVTGVQLDIDAPTRLLPLYERVLRNARDRLPAGTTLSITGLPTWTSSSALRGVLAAVDFWVPQCYGSVVPDRLDDIIPISLPEAVAQAVRRVRVIGRPFWVGLAAYGYAIHYSREGRLLEISGSLDPSLVVNSSALDLVEQRPFDAGSEGPRRVGGALTSEWRTVYRVRTDTTIGGLELAAGEWLMLDLPTAAALRASAALVRQIAGDYLLGICVFRLPSKSDATALTIEEVAASLSDQPSEIAIGMRARAARAGEQDQSGISAKAVELTITNAGTARPLVGPNALLVDLRVPPRSLRSLATGPSVTVETLCGEIDQTRYGEEALQRCGPRRATVVRLMARSFKPGDAIHAVVRLAGDLPEAIDAQLVVRTDEGLVWSDRRAVPVSY